jgi:hypothetical protein
VDEEWVETTGNKTIPGAKPSIALYINDDCQTSTVVKK